MLETKLIAILANAHVVSEALGNLAPDGTEPEGLHDLDAKKMKRHSERRISEIAAEHGAPVVTWAIAIRFDDEADRWADGYEWFTIKAGSTDPAPILLAGIIQREMREGKTGLLDGLSGLE